MIVAALQANSNILKMEEVKTKLLNFFAKLTEEEENEHKNNVSWVLLNYPTFKKYLCTHFTKSLKLTVNSVTSSLTSSDVNII